MCHLVISHLFIKKQFTQTYNSEDLMTSATEQLLKNCWRYRGIHYQHESLYVFKLSNEDYETKHFVKLFHLGKHFYLQYCDHCRPVVPNTWPVGSHATLSSFHAVIQAGHIVKNIDIMYKRYAGSYFFVTRFTHYLHHICSWLCHYFS